MKALLKTFVLALLVTVSFIGGVVTSLTQGWGDSAVRIEISNMSSEAIESFRVSYSTCGTTWKLEGQRLPPGRSETVRFTVCGEGGYVAEAVLPDGRVVKGTEVYVESGY